MKEGGGVSQRACTQDTQTQRAECVGMARGKGAGLGGGGQRGENGDICNSVNNKNKEKNNKVQHRESHQ